VIKRALKDEVLSLENAELDAKIAEQISEKCGDRFKGKKLRRKKR